MPARTYILADLLYIGAWLALIGLPLALLASFLFGDLASSAQHAFPGVTVAEPLASTRALFVLLTGLVPGLAVLYAIWQCQALFKLYRLGHTLSAEAAQRIRQIGMGCLAAALLSILVRPVQVLILTAANAPGERAVAISFSSGDVGFALAGGLMIVIGATMAEAARIAEEHKAII
ncbi:MAG: DUF2975 domain-containing protein [Pseudomonadota bacterium]